MDDYKTGSKDVRWHQRYANFSRSVDNLLEALEVTTPSKLERQGIIKSFELCYELAWKTLQDYLKELGMNDVIGPKAVIRTSFQEGLLSNGDTWRDMHQARSESAHLYDKIRAETIEKQIRNTFVGLLVAVRDRLGREIL